jgi:transposase
MQVTTIGLDLAKNVFQVHGITMDDEVAFNRPLMRAQLLPFFAKLEPCLIGMESCSSAHHWARELTKFGHDVRLIPPMYVKPYVKRGKSDAIDAEAICEAVIRGMLREFGYVLPTGVEAVIRFSKSHLEGDQPKIPELANGVLGTLCYQLLGLSARIDGFSKLIESHARQDANARRLMQVPGIGPITASAIVATIGDPARFWQATQ